MRQLIRNLLNLYRNKKEEKHLVLTLQNPLDNTDTLDLKIVLKDNPISQEWYNQVVKCLNDKLHLEKNFCWLGWPDPNRDVNFLKDQLQKCVDSINKFSKNNPVWGGYRIKKQWKDISDHDALNKLHHHFEILMGQVWNVSEYMKTADDQTKYQIRQLNNLVHELQSRKNVEGVDFKHIQPMSIISYLNVTRELFKDEFYDYFNLNRELGDVYLHYTQTGKTPIEAFTDDDHDVFNDNINALRYISGEYNIWWGDSTSSSEIEKTKNNLRDWLNERNLIKEEGPAFNYYIDHDGNKQGIGWVSVAKIVNPFSTKDELLRAVITKLNIVKLTAYKDNQVIAEHSWPYSWADNNYRSSEIEILKDYFPR